MLIEDTKQDYILDYARLHPVTELKDVLPCFLSKPDVEEFPIPFFWPDLGYEQDKRVLPDGRIIVLVGDSYTWSTPY